jgi:tRNA (guanine37-N1)-methyltransferase
MRKKIKPKSYKEIINIPKNLMKELPSSFDVIGEILLIKIKDNLLQYKKEIAEALLQIHKNIRTVCLIYPVSGELRTRKLEIIGGESSTETIHKEYGLNFFVDVEKTYFSSRLANERLRISKIVKTGETIIDMFTGVAPFSIMIVKFANPKIIYAFDVNKKAIGLAKKNVKINKALDKIELIVADSKNAPEILHNKKVRADRILMNLPFSAFEFFPSALQIIADQGIIHYYEILNEEDISHRINDLKDKAKDCKIKLSKINFRKIKSYSPREFYIAFDITAKRVK